MVDHRQALERVIEALERDNPDCAVLLAGSVHRGTEHPGSDIDMCVVVPDIGVLKADFGQVEHSTPRLRVVQARLEGVAVTLTCWGPDLLDEMVRAPWRNYLFAKAGLLRDPLGIAGEAQRAINEWFGANPAVEVLWTEQERKHARCKSALRRGREASLEFASWDAFADHVDRLVRRGAVPGTDRTSPDRL